MAAILDFKMDGRDTGPQISQMELCRLACQNMFYVV